MVDQHPRPRVCLHKLLHRQEDRSGSCSPACVRGRRVERAHSRQAASTEPPCFSARPGCEIQRSCWSITSALACASPDGLEAAHARQHWTHVALSPCSCIRGNDERRTVAIPHDGCSVAVYCHGRRAVSLHHAASIALHQRRLCVPSTAGGAKEAVAQLFSSPVSLSQTSVQIKAPESIEAEEDARERKRI